MCIDLSESDLLSYTKFELYEEINPKHLDNWFAKQSNWCWQNHFKNNLNNLEYASSDV